MTTIGSEGGANCVSLREAEVGDLDRLAEIELAAASLFPPGRVTDAEATFPAALLRKSLSAGLLFVAEDAGIVVGFATASSTNGFLHLDEISVHPDAGRKGIGAALVQRIIDIASEKHLTGVTLTTFSDLPWNAPFYRKLGFHDVQKHTAPVHVGQHLDEEIGAGMTHRVGMLLPLKD